MITFRLLGYKSALQTSKTMMSCEIVSGNISSFNATSVPVTRMSLNGLKERACDLGLSTLSHIDTQTSTRPIVAPIPRRLYPTDAETRRQHILVLVEEALYILNNED